MPEVTDATLLRLIESGLAELVRIEAVRETADSRYIGAVGISFRHPTFHGGGISGELSPDSRFLVKHVEGRLGIQLWPSDDDVYDGEPAFEARSEGMEIRLVEFPPVASYPRRFHLTGTPEEWDAGEDRERLDVTPDILARLGNEGVEWYVPTRDELKTEAGL